MSMHRQVAQMMRSADAPPVGDANWAHLWRMVDTFGTTVPDSVSSMDLTLGGGATIDAGGEGVDIAANAARMATTADQSDIDLVYPSTDEYTIFLSMQLRSLGSGTEYGYPIVISDRTIEPLLGYIRTANGGFRYYRAPQNSVDINCGGDFDATAPLDMAFVKGSDPLNDTIHIFFHGTYSTSSTADRFCTCIGVAASPFVLGNSFSYDRGMDAVYHWAGIYHGALSLAEVTTIIEAGRPVAP